MTGPWANSADIRQRFASQLMEYCNRGLLREGGVIGGRPTRDHPHIVIEVDAVTWFLCQRDLDFLYLHGFPPYPEEIRHLPRLANFIGVPWGDKASFPKPAKPVGPADDDQTAEKTYMLNPKPYPLSAHDGVTFNIMGMVVEGRDQLEVGVDRVTTVLGRGMAQLVIIAADADPYKFLLHLPSLAKFMKTDLVFVPSREELGSACEYSRHMKEDGRENPIIHPHVHIPSVSVCCITRSEGTRISHVLRHFSRAFNAGPKLPDWIGPPDGVEDEVEDDDEEVEDVMGLGSLFKEVDDDIFKEVEDDMGLGSLFKEVEDDMVFGSLLKKDEDDGDITDDESDVYEYSDDEWDVYEYSDDDGTSYDPPEWVLKLTV